jgi:hypothetical protein
LCVGIRQCCTQRSRWGAITRKRECVTRLWCMACCFLRVYLHGWRATRTTTMYISAPQCCIQFWQFIGTFIQ